MCTAVVHLPKMIICWNAEITNVLILFENRIVSLQLKSIAGCDALLKRNKYTILLSSTEITFVISVLQQMISVKCTTAMHTGWSCAFGLLINSYSPFILTFYFRHRTLTFVHGLFSYHDKTLSNASWAWSMRFFDQTPLRKHLGRVVQSWVKITQG